MISETQFCKCKNQVKYICLDHHQYICEQERSQHHCKVIDVNSFAKAIRLDKIDFLKKLKGLKKENKQNEQELLAKHRNSFIHLQNLNTTIKGNLDSLIGLYSKIIEDSFDEELNTNVEEIEQQLSQYEASGNYIEIQRIITEKPFGKLRKEERSKFFKLKDFFIKNDYFGDINHFLIAINKNITDSLDSLKENKLDNLMEINFKQTSKKFGVTKKYHTINEVYLNRRSSKFNSYIRVKDRSKVTSVEKKGNEIIDYFTNVKKNIQLVGVDQFMSNHNNSAPRTPLEPALIEFGKQEALSRIESSNLSNESESFKKDTTMAHGLGSSMLINDAKNTNDQFEYENQIDDNLIILRKEIIGLLEDAVKKIQNPVYFNQFNKVEVKRSMKQFINKVEETLRKIQTNWSR